MLAPGGHLWVCELHPYKQYAGSQARFAGASGDTVKVDAFYPSPVRLSPPPWPALACTCGGSTSGGIRRNPLALPRLISFLFQR